MKKLAVAILLLGVAAAIVFFVLTMPASLTPQQAAAASGGDAARGERMFYAGGCTSCHAAPGAKGDEKLKLAGGHEFATPFGTFYAPNISPSLEHGLGGWTAEQFANAMLNGVSPKGQHYYPAFPFTSYSRMKVEDVADLWAYMQTLPAVEVANREHDLPLPFRLRRGLGMWKLLFFKKGPVIAIDESNEQLALGRYLVEGPGHCGECHTPRNPLGGADHARWLGGGPAPEGKGNIPNITPHETGIGSWSIADIAYSLESGFTPTFDSFGSTMVDVQQNMAELPAADREAIAAYLKAVPAVVLEKRASN
jgi:mono/diheme cytochrome c family protein